MSRDPRNEIDARDDVATLMRIAGKRPEAPRDRAERVRAAAHDAWCGELRRNGRKRIVLRTALLAAAASLALAVGLRGPFRGSGEGRAAIRVEALAGPGNVFSVGDELTVGSEISTAEHGRAAIRVASGHSVRLDGSTTIRVLEGGRLALDRGALYVDSGIDGTPAGSLTVQTPLGVIEEIGTQFEARLDGDSLRLRLREGAVILHHGPFSDEARFGTELTLTADGSVERREILPHGPEWDWVLSVTPMLDLEGRSAEEFLRWASRERGWRLAWESEAVARSAAGIVLGGGAAHLTPEEALDAVLPASRLTYRIEDGVLYVAEVGS